MVGDVLPDFSDSRACATGVEFTANNGFGSELPVEPDSITVI
jgi:citrate lyase beta subunit